MQTLWWSGSTQAAAGLMLTFTITPVRISINPFMLSTSKDALRSANMVMYCITMPGEALAGGTGPTCCVTNLSCNATHALLNDICRLPTQ